MGKAKSKIRTVEMKKKIYILPGWAYDTKKWDIFVDKLDLVGFDCNVLKIPGLHLSIEKPWDINDYVEWLSKILKEEKSIVLLGHSNGGRIALSYILKYPDKVSNLILIDSAGIYHKDLSLRVKRLIFKYLAKTGKKFTKSESLKNLLYKFARENDYNVAPEVMKKTMQNLITHDLTPQLPKIKTNTLIIWGENDKTTTLSDGKLMNKKIHGSKFRMIEDARHSPQFTHSKIVVELIKNFL